MSITVGQIPAALVTVKALQAKLNDINCLLSQAKDLSSNNWQVDIGDRFSLIVSITPAQQQGLVGQYDTFKSQLVTTFQQLP